MTLYIVIFLDEAGKRTGEMYIFEDFEIAKKCAEIVKSQSDYAGYQVFPTETQDANWADR